jgi:hypothetical protein
MGLYIHFLGVSKYSIQTHKTSQHPKTKKTQGDETACDDQPQGPPSNIKSHQRSPIKIIYKPTFSRTRISLD